MDLYKCGHSILSIEITDHKTYRPTTKRASIFALYYKQLPAYIKRKKYMIKYSFDSAEGPKSRANKTSINFMFFFILIFIENCL